MVLRDFKPVMAWGVAVIVGSLQLIFGNALASEKAAFANYRNQIEAQNGAEAGRDSR